MFLLMMLACGPEAVKLPDSPLGEPGGTDVPATDDPNATPDPTDDVSDEEADPDACEAVPLCVNGDCNFEASVEPVLVDGTVRVDGAAASGDVRLLWYPQGGGEAVMVPVRGEDWAADLPVGIYDVVLAFQEADLVNLRPVLASGVSVSEPAQFDFVASTVRWSGTISESGATLRRGTPWTLWMAGRYNSPTPVTGSGSEYSFRVPAGEFSLSLDIPDGLSMPGGWPASGPQALVADTRTDLNVTPRRLAGTVAWVGDTAVPAGHAVAIHEVDRNLWLSAPLSADGHFEVYVAEGEYEILTTNLDGTTGWFIPLAENVSVAEDVDLNLQASPIRTLVRPTLDGELLSGRRWRATVTDPARGEVTWSSPWTTASEVALSVPPGAYDVWIESAGGWTNSAGLPMPDALRIARSLEIHEDGELDLDLPTASTTLQLSYEGGDAVGRAEQWSLWLRPSDLGSLAPGDARGLAGVMSGAQARVALPAGDYTVEVLASAPRAGRVVGLVPAGEVTVAEVDVEASLVAPVRRVSGRVTGLWAGSGRRVVFAGENAEYTYEASVEDDGTFDVWLPRGTYRISGVPGGVSPNGTQASAYALARCAVVD